MPLGYHLTFGAYGFWLPNDPRGSWSEAVWARPLRPFGPPVRPAEARSVAHAPHDRRRRLAAKRRLARPAVRLSGVAARAVARGVAQAAGQLELALFALAVMPDHVHLVTATHRDSPDKLLAALKAAATRQLVAEGQHPFADHAAPGGRRPGPGVAGKSIWTPRTTFAGRSSTCGQIPSGPACRPSVGRSWCRLSRNPAAMQGVFRGVSG